ncbi:MAG: MFS transporter [Clostridiales bacterium]|jgi:MFS family permease|nr:MFS transporter [Clostridiales bacterium]
MAESDSLATPAPKNFRLMVAGQIVTVLGSSLLRFALSLYVLDITGRADVFAAMFALSSIPFLLGPVGGTLSDRFNRRVLMVLYDAACGTAALAFLLFLATGHESVLAAGAVMVFLGIVQALETPNGIACVPLLVESGKLESANGTIQAVQSLSGIVAPILGGILYSAVGLRPLVAVSAIAFVLAAVMERFINIPYFKRPHEGSIVFALVSEMKDGFAFVWKDKPILRLMVVAALLNLALTPCFIVACPLVLRVTMHSTETMYGVGMGIINVASILGAFSIGAFSKKMSIPGMWRWILGIALTLVPMAICVTPVMLGLGFWPSFSVFMLSMIVMVAAGTILSIFVIVRIQAKTPIENLGKVMAIVQAVAQCAAPVGQMLYGAAFQAFLGEAYIPFLLVGALTMAIAFIAKVMLKGKDEELGATPTFL